MESTKPTATFQDSKDRVWTLRITDVFTLDRIEQEAGVNLEELAGWSGVEAKPRSLVKVLCVLCAAQMKANDIDRADFVGSIVGDVQEAALTALMAAGQSFFPRKKWSAMEAALASQRNRKTSTTAFSELAGMTEVIDQIQRLPAGVKEVVWAEMQQQAVESGAEHSDLSRLRALVFASPSTDAEPAKAAIDSPGSAEQQPAA